MDLSYYLSSITRNNDFIIRIGGDEFCLLLKNCPEDMAETKIQDMTKAFVNKHNKYSIGISYGIAMFSKSFDDTMKKSDSLMYTMKEKNKVVR